MLKKPLGVVAALALLTLAGCKARELPEQDSYAGQLYMKRCGGQCHVAYDPRTLTEAMWQVKVDAMEPKMLAAGIAPLTPDQRQTILDYLARNAGSD